MTHGKTFIALTLIVLLAACTPPEERAAGYVKKAQDLYAASDFVKAKLEAQNALQIEPKNADARYLLALMAEEEGDYRNMYNHLLVALDSNPDDVDVRVKLGNLQFLGQLWDDAAAQAAALLELAPGDARVRLLNARVLIQQGERDAGLAEVAKALELDPDNVDAVSLQVSADSIADFDKGLATLDAAIARLDSKAGRELRELRLAMLTREGRDADVEKELVALARDYPAEGNYETRLARFYAEEGRVDDAERLLRRVAELDPTDQKRIGYAQFLATQKDADQAEAALKAFIEETPDADVLRLALGQLYEGMRRAEDARSTYQALADRSPRTEEGIIARNRLAALDIADDKPESALARVEAVLADVPDQPEALLLRATSRFTNQRYDEAIADLRGVLRRTPADERALLLLGEVYSQQGDRVLAKDTYRRLLDAHRDSAEGLRRLALLMADEQNFDEAESLLRRRLSAQPDDARASATLVEVLLIQNQLARAEEEARRFAGLTDRSGIGDIALARVLMAKEDYAGAAEFFRKAADARPGDTVSLDGLVRALVMAGKSQDAVVALNRQIERGGEPAVQARHLLVNVYQVQGDHARATRLAEELVREYPEDMRAYLLLAGVHDKDAAARQDIYRRGLKALPGNPQLGLLLASEFDRAGRPDDAISVYEDILAANPELDIAINNLAATLLDHREDPASTERAVKLAERLKDSGNPVMLDTLGWAYYRAGQHQEAVGVLERVVARDAQSPIYNYHLGMAYLAAGNEVGARQQLEQATAAEVEYPGVEEARAALKKLM